MPDPERRADGTMGVPEGLSLRELEQYSPSNTD